MTRPTSFLALTITIALTGLTLIVWPAGTGAQESFYKGKSIRIVVGYPPGGGFDIYSRAISRHIGKHISGNPVIYVENMPGSGGLIAANHLYKVAKPDGLTIGNFAGGLFMQQLKGSVGIEFDALKFEFLGAPMQSIWVCALTKKSGITSMESWIASSTPVKMGAAAPGGSTYDAPKILQTVLGVPIQLVSGYKGTADIRLAVESGEVAGGCFEWESMKTTWRRAIESGDVVIVVQFASKPQPDLPKVPLALSYAKTKEARQLVEVGATMPGIIGRPYVVPPATTQDRVKILRRAFMDTMADPEFMADAKNSKLDLDPLSGEEIQKVVAEMFKLPLPLVDRLKE